MTKITRAENAAQIQVICELASIIWSEHYTPIIGFEQVTYMLDKFQSVAAIKDQIHKEVEYYLLIHDEKPAGYFCVNRKEDALFLSKLYVLNTQRGKGIGKMALLYIEHKAVSLNYHKISLTVNKYNYKAIKAYEKMGFKIIKRLIQDIGNNYIMDDYLLEKDLTTNDC